MTTGIRRDQHRGWEIRPGEVTPTELDSSVYGLVGDITSIDPDDTAAAGATGRLADAGHQHAFTTGTPVSVGTALAEGSAATSARSDHVHDLGAGSIDDQALFTANLLTVAFNRANPSTNRSTSSTSYVNWPTTDTFSVSHTKKIAGSQILVLYGGGGYATVANDLAQFAVRVDSGADTEIAKYFFNALNDHRAWSGGALLAGIGAGAHTYNLRAKLGGSGGTLNADTGDPSWMLVLELP